MPDVSYSPVGMPSCLAWLRPYVSNRAWMCRWHGPNKPAHDFPSKERRPNAGHQVEREICPAAYMQTDHVVVEKLSVLVPRMLNALYLRVRCDFISCLYLQRQRHSGSNAGYRGRDVWHPDRHKQPVLSSRRSGLRREKRYHPRTMLTPEIYKLLIFRLKPTRLWPLLTSHAAAQIVFISCL